VRKRIMPHALLVISITLSVRPAPAPTQSRLNSLIFWIDAVPAQAGARPRGSVGARRREALVYHLHGGDR
jgi:hypothetical protein